MAPVVARSQKSIFKKDGAGGSYTWGRAMDCQEHYYEPVGVDSAGVGLTVAPPVASPVERTQVATTFDTCIDDAAEFPSLGSAATPSSRKGRVSKKSSSTTAALSAASASSTSTPSTTPSTSTRTPPSTPPPPPPQLAFCGEEARTATETDAAAATTKETLVITAPTATLPPVREKQAAFDARHPRNSFAKIPKKAATETQSPAVAIDWSAEGAPSVQQAAYKSLPNPAHLGPFAEKHATSQVPLAVLKMQEPLVQQHVTMVNNKGFAKQPHQQFARPKIAQPRKR